MPRAGEVARWPIMRLHAQPHDASAPLGSELAEHAAIVGLDPLIGEAPLVVVAEDVGQLEDHPLAVRRQKPDRRVREVANEGPGDGRLAGDVVVLYDDDAPLDCQVVERGPQRRKVDLSPATSSSRLMPATICRSFPDYAARFDRESLAPRGSMPSSGQWRTTPGSQWPSSSRVRMKRLIVSWPPSWSP